MSQQTDNKVDWLDKPYYSLNAYFKNVYGQKVYKIAVDAGLSCPNRDGTLDTKGCIFCSKGGSGDFAVRLDDQSMCGQESLAKSLEKKHGCDIKLSVKEQIKQDKAKFNKQAGDKFVIYFQAFTNTYGNPDYLRRIWTEALEEDDVVGISIATRPDCLGSEILEILKELSEIYCDNTHNNIMKIDVSNAIEKRTEIVDRENTVNTQQETTIVAVKNEVHERDENTEEIFQVKYKQKFIWVELGLQTIHDKSAEYIRRHYPLSEYESAVRKLHKLGIPYITHVILGLPGETRDEMLETVFYVEQGVFEQDSHSKIRPFGMKLQLLHVLEDTDLAEDYRQGKFKTMEMEEYLELVIDCLQRINPEIVIHRVTGDGPKKILISPTWSGNKKQVLNTLHRMLRERDARQGDYAIAVYDVAGGNYLQNNNHM